MEVGIDIEKNERFKNVSAHLIERAFTKSEIEYAKKFVNSHEQFCAFWCVKEACVKAFSNLKIPYQEIEEHGICYSFHHKTRMYEECTCIL